MSRQDYNLTHPAQQRGKKKTPHLLPPESKHKSHPTQGLQNPLDQPYPPRTETKRKKEFDPEDWEKETSNTVS